MKVSTLAIAALLTMSAPAAVLAQGAIQPADPAAGVSAGANVGASTGAGAGAQAGDLDFNTFLQGFGSADFTAASSGLSGASSYEIVKLSTLENADATRLQGIIDQHQTDIGTLHSSVAANTGAMSALEAAGVTSDQIVWIETDAGGVARIYVNDLDTATM